MSFPISRAVERTVFAGKVFGGKYRSCARMIFPKPGGPDLAGGTGRCATFARELE